MDDYICRQAALDALRTMQTYKLSADDDMYLIDQAETMTELMLLPSADAVEVVRCKECKRYIRHDKRCGYWNHGVKQGDWCSYGERKDEQDM